MDNKTATGFRFYTRQNLIFLLGRRAKNLSELLAGIKAVPPMTIFQHTHHYLIQHEHISPEPPNDFAYWITSALQDKLLGEKVASIDLRRYSDLEKIRSELINIVATAQEDIEGMPHHNSPSGEEFHFMSARSFVFPTKYVANTLQEFKECLEKISVYSIYFHVFEARFHKKEFDFSLWLSKSLGEEKLAEEFSKLDPYTQTIENLRKTLVKLIMNKLEGNKNGKA